MRARVPAVLVATVTSLLVALPIFAGANHLFPDVPSGSAFHDDISEFADAGCATGFPDGSFRPQDPVKRQQMARFFAACGGRAETAETEPPLPALATSDLTLASVTVDGGALGGSGGQVLVVATTRAFTLSVSGYPCRVLYRLQQAGGPAPVDFLPVEFADQNSGTSHHITGTLLALVPVGAETSVTVDVIGRVDTIPSCGAAIQAGASVTAHYVPFAQSGGP